MYSNFPRATSDFPRATSEFGDEFQPQLPLTNSVPPHLFIHTEFDSLHSPSSYSTASSYNSPSSLASCVNNSLIQRSASNHSLPKNSLFHCHFAEFVNSEFGHVRRVSSTGDLQGGYMQRMNMRQHSSRSCSPLSSESHMIIESMSRACRYSPEEKKERIEKYRNKRNHRNFNKKIKYECRKTLADSRPRIRGRFARNEETENRIQTDEIENHTVQWSTQTGGEELDGIDYDNWINFLDSLPSNLIA